MSWDASIMKFPEGADLESAEPIAMGTVREVRELLERDLGKVIWNSLQDGYLRKDQCSMEVGLAPKIDFELPEVFSEEAMQKVVELRKMEEGDQVFSIDFNVRGGGGDPVGMLVELCKAQDNWALIDFQNALPIDLDDPSRETWEGWTGFRAEVAGELGNNAAPATGLSIPANLAISVVFFAVVGFGLKKLLG